jgi:hypothetical protein
LYSFQSYQGQPSRRFIGNHGHARVCWKLIEIKTSGTQRYGHDEIVAASGLRIGDTVTDDDFKKAAQRLGEQEYFRTLHMDFLTRRWGQSLTFSWRMRRSLCPCDSENFVWFTDEGGKGIAESGAALPRRGSGRWHAPGATE